MNYPTLLFRQLHSSTANLNSLHLDILHTKVDYTWCPLPMVMDMNYPTSLLRHLYSSTGNLNNLHLDILHAKIDDTLCHWIH